MNISTKMRKFVLQYQLFFLRSKLDNVTLETCGIMGTMVLQNNVKTYKIVVRKKRS